MSERLDMEELAMVRTLVPTECHGLLAAVDSMTREIATRRAMDMASEQLAKITTLTAERDALAAKLKDVTRERDRLRTPIPGTELYLVPRCILEQQLTAASARAEQAERELATNMAEYHRTYAAAIDRAEQAERQLSTVVRDVRMTAEGDIYNAEQERDDALRSWADAANERDEALAEVERLRGLLADACRRIDWMAGSNDITNRLRREGGLKITKETP